MYDIGSNYHLVRTCTVFVSVHDLGVTIVDSVCCAVVDVLLYDCVWLDFCTDHISKNEIPKKNCMFML